MSSPARVAIMLGKHLFNSLQSAARLAIIQDGFRLDEINFDRWATTYRVSPDDVREAFRIAENGKRKLPEETAASLPPQPNHEEPEE
jgi:hypothetical protein